jgi:hypothetical protein
LDDALEFAACSSAMFKAASAKSAVLRSPMDQPASRQFHTSRTTA